MVEPMPLKVLMCPGKTKNVLQAAKWEFPEIRGPTIEPKLVGLES